MLCLHCLNVNWRTTMAFNQCNIYDNNCKSEKVWVLPAHINPKRSFLDAWIYVHILLSAYRSQLCTHDYETHHASEGTLALSLSSRAQSLIKLLSGQEDNISSQCEQASWSGIYIYPAYLSPLSSPLQWPSLNVRLTFYVIYSEDKT